MKLLFRQRFFSWFSSYDIYDENGDVFFHVEGKPSWGQRVEIYDARDNYLGMLKQKVMSWLPRYTVFIGEEAVGEIVKEFTLFKPSFRLSFSGWSVTGSFMEWDYQVLDAHNRTVMTASKELLQWTDTYAIDVVSPEDALICLMIVLAIDAEKAARS